MSAMAAERKGPGGPADEEEKRRAFYRAKRGKNLAVLAALLGFAVLVYLVSIVRMSG